MSKFQSLYRGLLSSRPKERFETILEPMQAMARIACLSVCPTGTKVTIQNNLLYVQHPGWTQGIFRAYNNDNKDDLFFLFNVITRFISFYRPASIDASSIRGRLYELVRTMAMDGIDRLVQTYNTSDKHSLLHTLHMYKSMLASASTVVGDQDWGIAPRVDLSDLVGGSRRTSRSNSLDDVDSAETSSVASGGGSAARDDGGDLNTIFVKIVKVYGESEMQIMYHTLLCMHRDQGEHESYIEGLEKIMEPTNRQIRKWITDNIVF